MTGKERRQFDEMDDMAKWSAASGGIVDSGVRVLRSGGGMVVMVDNEEAEEDIPDEFYWSVESDESDHEEDHESGQDGQGSGVVEGMETGQESGVNLLALTFVFYALFREEKLHQPQQVRHVNIEATVKCSRYLRSVELKHHVVFGCAKTVEA
ncbi:hypothetical protein Patl1_05390 [Pistacia atlantica]|uniref:Uncharacterized protein n=1 Tax=Pistacia atlantica TaxID=434234 RepID=A0ACC1BTY4_9ROSI|nr:hypothetical protein Patl1_05390 [Pistacia atlantica]